MKIAAVTDDGITISRHFGRAKYYVILTVEEGQIIAREQVVKAAHHGHHHHHHHGHDHNQVHLHDDHDHEHNDEHGEDEAARHADMFTPLQGCDVLLARGMGFGAHIGLNQIGVQPIITEIASIEEAAQAVMNGSIVDHPEKLH